MRSFLLPSLVAVGITVALAGSYSALAGEGPVDDVVGIVVGSDETDDGDGTSAVTQEADAENIAGGQKAAQVIADEFESTQEGVLALHDEGIGFGALFKLYSIARARGISVDDLLAEIEADGGGFAFGKMFKALTDEEQAVLQAGPKNLGKLVSASNKDGGAGGEASAGASELSNDRGDGLPESAKAHGRR